MGGIILKVILILSAVFSLSVHSPAAQNVRSSVKIGVVSMITPRHTVEYYQDIIDYLSAKLHMPVEMVFRKTYDEMDKMLEKGEVDAAFICSSPYVEDRKKFGAELLVAPQVNGSVMYRSFIIVHKDSDIKNIDDLKGRSFAFTDPKSNSGKLYPTYRLAKNGHTPEKYFSKYIYSYSHNKSVELVAKKIVDGAAVENLIYQYMIKEQSPYVEQTRIIEISREFGIPPLVTTPRVSTFLKEKMKELFVNMHEDRTGRKILSSMLIDKFVESSDSNYDSIREMLAFTSKFNVTDIAFSLEKKVIFVGVVPRDNPRIAYEKYQPIVDYLSESTAYEFELTLEKTYDNIVSALGRGDIDIAFLGPLTYLNAHKKFGAVSILRSVTDKDEPTYRSVIVTRKNHSVNNLSDLKGKDFAFAAMESTSGNLIPRLILAEEGIHLKELRSYSNFDFHESVIKWILKGKYDAGAVRESVAEKYIPQGLRVLSISGPIPTGPIVVGTKTPYAIVETIKHNLLNLNKTESGMEVLKKLDPEMRGGFIEASDSDYEHIRHLINKVPFTCGLGCHPKMQL